MSAGVEAEDHSSDEGSEWEELAGGELRNERRISYSRDYLLSLADLEVCKKLPCGVDESALRELDECCQQSSALSSDGVLGNFTKPILIARADAAASKSYQTKHLLSRSSQPYRPPSFYKAANHPRRESSDLYNDDTFGSNGIPGPQRVQEERRRKASFDSTGKWQKKVVQGDGQSLLGDQKENCDHDIRAPVNHSLSGTELSSGSIIVPSFASGLEEDKPGLDPLIQSPEPQPYDTNGNDKKASKSCTSKFAHLFAEGDKRVANTSLYLRNKSIDAVSGASSGMLLERDLQDLSAENQATSKLLLSTNATSEENISEVCHDSLRSAVTLGNPTQEGQHCTVQGSKIYKEAEQQTSSIDIDASKHLLIMSQRAARMNELDMSREIFRSSDEVFNPNGAVPYTGWGVISKPGNSRRHSSHISEHGGNFMKELQSTEASVSSLKGSRENSKKTKAPKQLTSSIDLDAYKELPTMLQRAARMNELDMRQDIIRSSDEVYNPNGAIPYTGRVISKPGSSGRHSSHISERVPRMNELDMSQEIISSSDEVYNPNRDIPYTGQAISKPGSSGRHSSRISGHGRNFMKELQSRESSVSSLEGSREKLKKVVASELCKYHPTHFNPVYHKSRLPHLQNPPSQPVIPSKLKVGVPAVEGLKFKPLHGFSEKAGTSVGFQLPEDDGLIRVDDTVIYQPPTRMPSSNPRNRMMGQGGFRQVFNSQSQQHSSWYGQSQVHANDALQMGRMAYQNPSSNPQLPGATDLPRLLRQTPAATRVQQQVPEFSVQRMQHNEYSPPYVFDDPATDTAVYGFTDQMNQMPYDALVPDFMENFPLGYQQNLNPNMSMAVPGFAIGGNNVGFDRQLEMEMRLQQLMDREARVRYQRDLNHQRAYRF